MKDYITVDGKRVPMTNSMKELGRIGKEVRRRARISLKSRGKVVSGNLYNSIRYEQGVAKNEKSLNLRFSFPGADYWQYVDEGVKGAMSSAKAPRSPFRFGIGFRPIGWSASCYRQVGSAQGYRPARTRGTVRLPQVDGVRYLPEHISNRDTALLFLHECLRPHSKEAQRETGEGRGR